MQPRKNATSCQTHAISIMILNKLIAMEMHLLSGINSWKKNETFQYIKLHVIHKTLPQNQIDFTQNSDSTFKPLPQMEASKETFIDHQHGFHPYREDHI